LWQPVLPSDVLAVHSNPAWGGTADSTALVDLAGSGLPGRAELLNTRRETGDTHLVCCIPFFAYGIALGDIVRVRRLPDGSQSIERVVSKSGHKTSRIAVAQEFRETVTPLIHDLLDERRLVHEWHRAGFVAIDTGSDADLSSLVAALGDFVKSGAIEIEVA
jgi:hypothetical protein